MSVCFLLDCNEDIFKIFTNITHYVELIYTYHIPLFVFLGTIHTLEETIYTLFLYDSTPFFTPQKYIYSFTVYPWGVVLDRFVVPT